MIPFEKYHCLGRDFILLDSRDGAFGALKGAEMARLCARRFGVGASGILRIDGCSEELVEVMSYNLNGGQAELNVVDAACTAVFAKALGFMKEPAKIKINGQTVLCKMVSNHENMFFINIRLLETFSVQRVFQNFVMSYGNAQFCMVPIDEVGGVDVEKRGREISFGKRFPNGANVTFFQPDPNHLEIRHYEHQVDQETYTNGLCAIGAALSHAQNHPKENNYLIRAKGGEVQVSFTRSEDMFCNLDVLVLVNTVYSGIIK